MHCLPTTKGSADPTPAQHTPSAVTVFVSEDIGKTGKLLRGLHIHLYMSCMSAHVGMSLGIHSTTLFPSLTGNITLTFIPRYFLYRPLCPCTSMHS